MKTLLKRRTLILISALIAIAITSTSVAQVTIVNQYHVQVSPTVAGVHLVSGLANNSTVTELTNAAGSVSYVNITEYFQLGGVVSANVSGMLDMPSALPDSFYYLTNVSSFNGQNLVTDANLYSFAGNGSYYSDFAYNSTTGYTNNTSPVKILKNQTSTIGLYINVGMAAVGGPYTWSLNFAVNGYVTSSNNAAPVFTQYFVHVKVTTIVVT